MEGVSNVLVVGIGGQGVMTAAEVLAQTALQQGLDVKKTEVAGMAQRGGVVTSHVRFGERVLSPAIPRGEADLLLGFEPAEALRWLHYLRPGAVALVNRDRQAPPVVNLGLFDYPEDPVAEIEASGIETHALAAGEMARELGNPKLVNTLMLGAVSGFLPFPADSLREAILQRFRARKPALVELNAEAFDLGRACVTESAPA